MGFIKDAADKMKFCSFCVKLFSQWKLSFLSYILHYNMFYWRRHGPQHACITSTQLDSTQLNKRINKIFLKTFKRKSIPKQITHSDLKTLNTQENLVNSRKAFAQAINIVIVTAQPHLNHNPIPTQQKVGWDTVITKKPPQPQK